MSSSDIAIAEAKNLPKGWKWSTLGDVSEKPQYGWTTKANHKTGELKLLRTTDITSGSVDWSSVPYCTEAPEDVKKYLVASGDILISRAGSVGVSFLISKPERAVFASYLIRFRPTAGIDVKYFYYYLKSPAYWNAIGSSKAGIAVPNVNASKLAKVPIPVAPLDQQKRIVAEIEKQFSRLDEAVANLKRVKANLKRYKAAVLKAAVEGRLVETEASIARREGRTYETGAQLLQRILETRRKQWKGKGKYKEPAAPDITAFPELAEGWVATALDAIAKTASGGTPRRDKPTNYGGGIPWVKSGELGDSMVNQTEETLSTEGLESSSAKVFPKRTLCIALYGATIGKLAILDIDAATNQAVCGIFPAEGIDNRYLWCFLEAVRGKLIRLGKGGAQPNISQKILRNLVVPVPPMAEQVRIISEVERCFSLVYTNVSHMDYNLKRADNIRNAILRRAFNVGQSDSRKSTGEAHSSAMQKI